VRTGRVVIYAPLTTQIIEFRTYVQTVSWTKDVNEGHHANEEMGFNSNREWRFLWTFRCPMPSVSDFYVKYRAIELQQFTRGILRDIVRNSLNGVASTNVVEDIYDEGKAELLHKVEARFKQKCHR
jgi:hypothetical protein